MRTSVRLVFCLYRRLRREPDLFCVTGLADRTESSLSCSCGVLTNRVALTLGGCCLLDNLGWPLRLKLSNDVIGNCMLVKRAKARMLMKEVPAWGNGLRTERDKMLAGELYDALDPDLVRDRDRARDLCQTLNATRESERELRRQILLQLFAKGGDTVWMQPPFFCDYGSNIELGERVFFNFNCIVLDVCPVRIGDFTLFGPGVQILTPLHPLNAELRRQQEFAKLIEIGSDVWVGGGALILPGVHIGSRTVIGAGSVVTRDIPGDMFAAGNPCRVIRDISQENHPPRRPTPPEPTQP